MRLSSRRAPLIAVGLLLALVALFLPVPPKAHAANGSWTGVYFNNTTLTAPSVVTRNDGATLDFFFDGTAAPAPGVHPQNFSVRWTRTDTYSAATYRFTITTDDGMRVYVDNTLVLDEFFDQAPATYFADQALAAGSHTVKVEYYNGVNAGTARLSIQDVATLPPGWNVQYYANQNLQEPATLTRNDGQDINFDWGIGSPAPGIPVDHFSARWTRSLPFNDGVYQFTTMSDDGTRVFVDGQLILNYWVDQDHVTHQATKQMSAGQHTVVVEYYENAGGAAMQLTIDYRPDLGGFVTDAVAAGFNLPTAFAWAPDGRIFVTEKGGNVRIIKNGSLLSTSFYTVSPIATFQDRGLLGIALDPNFASNHYVYLSYTYDNNPPDTQGPKTAQIIRLTANGDVAQSGSKLVLLGSVVGSPSQPSCENFAPSADCIPGDGTSHSQGNLKFGPDGMLYAETGDGASFFTVDPLALRSIDPDRLSGKVLRLNPANGRGLADNPFYTGDLTATRSKVWAMGLRNDFRFNFRPGTNVILSGDVGWDTWEELNVVTRGSNMGWPCYEGDPQQAGYSAYQQCQNLYTAGGVTFGVYTYDHSRGSSAVVGGSFTGANSYPAAYQSTYFWGDYAQNTISTMQLDAQNQLVPSSLNTFTRTADGPVAIETGPDGDIYYLAINKGELRHIRFIGGNRPPVAVASGTPTSGLAPLSVSFSSAGSNDPDGQAITYDWNFGDGSAHSSATTPSHSYAANGVYTATLAVTDTLFVTSTATVTVTVGNTPPTATITSPADGSHYSIGDTITFAGRGDDTQDGVEPPSRLQWTVLLYHCSDATYTSCHTHTLFSQSGSGGTFQVADHGDFTYYVFSLTATDNGGLTGTKTATITPNRVNISFNANRAVNLAVDGSNQTVPFTHSVPQNSAHVIFATSPQTVGGSPVQFSGWSDGGAQQHTIVAAADATLSVTFIDVPTPTSTPTLTPTATKTATPANTPTASPTATPAPVTLSASVTPSSGSAPLASTAGLTVGGTNGRPVSYVIDWGDGALASTGNIAPPATTASVPHNFAFPGSFTTRVTVFNEAGTTATSTVAIAVAPATDTDGDGMPDGYETAHSCLNPTVADGNADADGDGVTNLAEYIAGTNPCVADTDGDGCNDGHELRASHAQGGDRDPTNPYDFYDVPVPVLTASQTTGVRDHVVTIADVIAVLYYIGTAASRGVNVNGVSYNTDLNANGIPDGQEYDRSAGGDPTKPWRSGPPHGAVTIGDAIAALSQVGDDCNAP